jgi:histidine ammonia-lyase
VTVSLDGRSLGVDDLVAVAREGAPVELSAESVARMQRSRQVLEEAAARGEQIYGATTGVGALKRVGLDPAATSRFNHTMILNCLVGQGPAVGEDVVRATLLRMANGFAGGATGVRPELAELTVLALNEGWPLHVRLRGSVGQADLAPLAELAAALLDRSGFQLELGEGLALIDNGSFSTALAGLAMADGLQLAGWLEAAAALDMEGFLANPSMLHRVLRERPYAGLQASAERLRLLLAGSALHDPGMPRNLQDPLTYRNVPQLHGALRDALTYAAGQLRIELNAAHSNPLVDVEEGRVLSVSCFEILPLAAALDFVRIALAPVLTSGNERSMKLLHAGFSGLPAGLAEEPESGDDGYTEFGVAGQALVAEARLLAAPVSFELASSSQAEGIEDRMTMAPLAARRLAEMVELGRALVAIELVVASRAVDLGPDRALGAGTRALHRFVRAHIPATGPGEAVPADLRALTEAIRTLDSSNVIHPAIEQPSPSMQHVPRERGDHA